MSINSRNPKVPFCDHKNLSLIPLLSQMNPFYTLTLSSFLRSILILSSHLRTTLPNGSFPSEFSNKILREILVATMRTTCPDHPSLLDFIVLIIFGEKYKLWSYLLYNSFWALSSVQIFYSVPSSQTPLICVFPLKWQAKFIPI